jgi:hypothetical protein
MSIGLAPENRAALLNWKELFAERVIQRSGGQIALKRPSRGFTLPYLKDRGGILDSIVLSSPKTTFNAVFSRA